MKCRQDFTPVVLSCRGRVISINNQNTTYAVLCVSPIINLKYNNNQDNYNKKINEIKNMSFKNECSSKDACCDGMLSLVSALFCCNGGCWIDLFANIYGMDRGYVFGKNKYVCNIEGYCKLEECSNETKDGSDDWLVGCTT